mmetsp:Transcript_2463/g.4783  ORF Transcript_2463/g.4783 Transcript_2463/m.4783 type:complete len:245 (+) Transcript_2463:2-736(+)
MRLSTVPSMRRRSMSSIANERTLEALRRHLPSSSSGRLLEVGSGTGANLSAAALAFRNWHIQPSDVDTSLLPKIATAAEQWSNVMAPVLLDAAAPAEDWPVEPPFDCILAVNFCHYAPTQATRGLFLGADRLLRPGGMLCIYGPFLQGAGLQRSLSSRVFNMALWLQSSEYGLRGLNELNEASMTTQLTCSAFETVHGKDVLHGADAGVFFVGFTKQTTVPPAAANRAKPRRPGSRGRKAGRRK